MILSLLLLACASTAAPTQPFVQPAPIIKAQPVKSAELVVSKPASPACFDAETWSTWAPGFDVRRIETKQKSVVGDSKIVVARVDPARWDLNLHAEAIEKGGRLTGEAWAAKRNLVAVTNAGMFAMDMSTHVGTLRVNGMQVGSKPKKYQSVAEFNRTQTPPFRIRDLAKGAASGDYANQLQNLRLIKKSGENRWGPQRKQWSEAALGVDQQGRILLIFSRSPYNMHALNKALLESDIDLDSRRRWA